MSDEGCGQAVRGEAILGKRSLRDREYRVKTYDFRRPDKFSKEQIRTVEIMHETFARLAETRLSQRLRASCAMKVGFVDQLTFQEFLDSIAGPTILAVSSVRPLKGAAILHLDGAAGEALLDRLFGAALDLGITGTAEKDRDAVPFHELTDIEYGVISLVLGGLLEDMGASWEPVQALEAKLLNIETEPRLCQIVPPSEMILLVGLELDLNGVKGRVNLVYPYIAIEPLVPRLSAQVWYSALPRGNQGGDQVLSAATAWRLENPAELVFEGESISIAELRSLRIGSLVPVPGLDTGEGSLRVGGQSVLGLRLRERRRDGRILLDVLGDAGVSAIPEGILTSATSTGRADGDPLGNGIAGLGRSLASLRDAVEKSVAGLGEGLRALAGRQEDLADRLLYGHGEMDGEARGAEREARPFASLAASPDDLLSAFLSNERPQLVALVLSWLDDALASRVLDGLPPAAQPEIVRRLGAMDRVLPDILAETERILARKLEAIRSDRRASGGVPKIVGILNLVPRATEKHVIESLEKLAPALAEEVKRTMFVFEDITLLDDASLDLLIGAAEERDLLVALKPVPDALRERIFTRIGARLGGDALARMREEYARIGRVRLSEADAAGQRVVAHVRALEEEGRIFIAPEGEG